MIHGPGTGESTLAKRIGELLVEKGVITNGQLTRALQSQLISGGHLGTCLVELGYAGVDELGETLADALHMRYARPEMLSGIPAWVIKSLDADIAERFQVVPIGKEDRCLHLAVISPSRLSSLSTKTGFKIVPWIAPEIHVLEALENYYGIPRRARFLRLSKAIAEVAHEKTMRKRPALPPVPSLSPRDDWAIHQSPTLAANDRGRMSGRRTGAAARSKNAPAPVAAGATRSVTATAATAATGVTATASAATASATATATAVAPELTAQLAEFSAELSRADDRSELSSLVVSFMSRLAPRSIFFGVKEESAYVWDWEGIDLNPARIAGVEIPLIEGSVFELLQGENSFRGRVPSDGGYSRFYGALGSAPPREILLLPVHLNDRLVAMLYAEGDSPMAIDNDDEIWNRLTEKVSQALHMLVLKMKIRHV